MVEQSDRGEGRYKATFNLLLPSVRMQMAVLAVIMCLITV
jgi:hypothetical protein